MIQQRFIELIASEVNVKSDQAAAAISLFDKGATVPFVARYRKDATGGLSENKLERIAERNDYFIALTARRDAFLENIEKQERLTDDIRTAFEACDNHLRLEDLSLPFKKQRNNRAAIAANKGLLPLADYIWAQSPISAPPDIYAEDFVQPEKQVLSKEEALEGARHILAECIAMNAEIRREVRQCLAEKGMLTVSASKAQSDRSSRYAAFADYKEVFAEVPDDKLLIILRGERDAALRVELTTDDEALIDALSRRFIRDEGSAYEVEIRAAVTDAYRRLLRPAIEAEVFAMARRKADDTMTHVCREQVRNLLLTAPVGPFPVLGICVWSTCRRALALVDEKGAVLSSRLLENTDEAQLEAETKDAMGELLNAASVVGMGIGSGPGGREALRLAQSVLRARNAKDVFATLVQDVGLVAYVQSPLAQEELPDMDESLRAAVSLARRLQDPLQELVKVNPAFLAVGRSVVGVNRKRLQSGIVRTIESVINRVGIDLNAASVEQLRYVSGLQLGVAQAIIEERNKRTAFKNRSEVLEVSGIGEKTYQQCIGFLKIMNGDVPLDASAIHPEAYPVVEKIAASISAGVEELVKSPERLRDIPMNDFAEDPVGPLTLEDIRFELTRVGRDPRRRFRPPTVLIPIASMDDLHQGMVIEGIVTNVTDFGIFINIGLEQEGLVHRSEVGRTILNDPKKALQVGDVVKVSILHVEKENQKISLSIKAAAKLPLTRPTVHREPVGSGRFAATDRDAQRSPKPWQKSGDDFKRRTDANKSGGGSWNHENRPPRQRGKMLAVPKTGRADVNKSDDGLLNTTLAEQLAALRDKIVSPGK